MSYSYTDILTRNIKLNFDDETDGEEAAEDIEDEEDEAEFDAE
ncbi:hypothetical protein PLO_1671 [Pediococcus acidilactici NGRI 0510Q]|nr:hypothetical protein PLO_1671 [Pediococcus acidilactici NGRI 0510Q]